MLDNLHFTELERNASMNLILILIRAIAEQLLKYCDCWTEETKHSTCVDLYGDFLVTINNR